MTLNMEQAALLERALICDVRLKDPIECSGSELRVADELVELGYLRKYGEKPRQAEGKTYMVGLFRPVTIVATSAFVMWYAARGGKGA